MLCWLGCASPDTNMVMAIVSSQHFFQRGRPSRGMQPEFTVIRTAAGIAELAATFFYRDEQRNQFSRCARTGVWAKIKAIGRQGSAYIHESRIFLAPSPDEELTIAELSWMNLFWHKVSFYADREVRMLISEVNVRWTGQCSAISISRRFCVSSRFPPNSISRSMRSKKPSFVSHSRQSSACLPGLFRESRAVAHCPFGHRHLLRDARADTQERPLARNGDERRFGADYYPRFVSPN